MRHDDAGGRIRQANHYQAIPRTTRGGVIIAQASQWRGSLMLELPSDNTGATTMKLSTEQFTGTEQYHLLTACSPARILCTDGAKYVAETAGAFWLIDLIASHQHEPETAKHPFQVWRLELDQTGNGATAICTDGNENEITRQKIDWTDFPDRDGVEIWLTDGVMLLPSEY
jgi:hypothetical protein